MKKSNRSQNKGNEYDKDKKKYDSRSSNDLLYEEIILVERKLEDDRARKRTRGPYRKSNVK